MEPVFVRSGSAGSSDSAPTVSTALEIADEVRSGNTDLEISKSLDSGFFPVRNAFRAEPILRERFAVALKLPRIFRYQRMRPFLILGLIPWLMLFELDREIAADDIGNASSRMFLDMFLLLACARDLVRPLPRHPRVTALVLLSATARFCFLLARTCMVDVHPLIVAAPLIGLVAAVVTALVSPTREQITKDILRNLELDPRAPPLQKNGEGSLVGAFAIAVLLPIVLLTTVKYVGIWGEALVMVAWGFFLPKLVAPNVDDMAARGSPYFSSAITFAAIVAGLLLTSALTGGVHFFVDAFAYALECTRSVAASSATKFIARESTEVTRNVHEAQRDIAFFMMTVIVAPIVEERVYRGALQRKLGERFGPRRAIAIAASVFGIAHLGIYRVAIYQTVLLGVGFGVAFEEGGLIASVVTHALWNLYLLL
jgi:membrane protease YdiL (CAAX protease family)